MHQQLFKGLSQLSQEAQAIEAGQLPSGRRNGCNRPRYSIYLLYQYKSTNTDAAELDLSYLSRPTRNRRNKASEMEMAAVRARQQSWETLIWAMRSGSARSISMAHCTFPTFICSWYIYYLLYMYTYMHMCVCVHIYIYIIIYIIVYTLEYIYIY